MVGATQTARNDPVRAFPHLREQQSLASIMHQKVQKGAIEKSALATCQPQCQESL